MIKDKVKKQKIGTVIKQDISEKQVKIAFLAIGSNLGNKKKNIENAKILLQSEKIWILKSSNNYETLSWPDKKKPKFINVVLKVKTTFNAIDLLKKCLNVEKNLGRFRSKKNEPRICDIDLIDFNGEIFRKFNEKRLILPHPRMHSRNFVLMPLFELSKSWIHPIKKVSINNLINSLKSEDLRSIKII